MPFFIPLGIPDFNGEKERDFFQFTYDIEDNDAIELLIQIRDGNKVIYEETITDVSKLTQGEHIWQWDGFDSNGILDSAKLTQAKSLNFYATGKDTDGNIDRSSANFEANYDEVEWVDVRIDKTASRIDVTLRVNLKDGGEKGTDKECYELGKSRNAPIVKICPWDKIPEKEIKKYGKTPIKSRVKNFEKLKEMALDGINTHWSRRYTNTDGTIINDKNWEIIVTAIQDENGMKTPEIEYITNGKPGRSRNWELSRILYYNIGYLDFSDWYNIKSDWRWRNESFAVPIFQETSAHEIGHEILLAYGGHSYSKKHKGTSTLLQSETGGLKYPKDEIDLMKYYDEEYVADFNKVVASEKDVLSLLWLTKLELK